jgi:hypothetical protein
MRKEYPSTGVLSTMRSPTSPPHGAAWTRLLLRVLVGGALTAGAVAALGGCQREGAATDEIELSDLSAMVVPRHELGTLAIGLPVSDDSGWKGNDAAAGDSLDPNDTGRSLARSGRLGGYALTYSNPSGFAAPHDERPIVVSTEVELFRDDAAASYYLRRQAAIAARLRGRRLLPGRIAAVERFEGGDVGQESEGIRIAVVSDRDVGYGTTIGFRHGRMVASVSILNQAETGGPNELLPIADVLEARIESVAAGVIRRRAVALPKVDWWHAVPDPLPLTLDGKAVVPAARLTHSRYLRTPDFLAFWRRYETPRERLGGSRILWLRTMTQAFKSVRVAERGQEYLTSARGRHAITRRLLRGWFRRTSFRPAKVEFRSLPASGGGTAGFRSSFDTPRGRMAVVVLSVRRGRVAGSVAVLGFDRELRSEDVVTVRPRLRELLDAA